MKKTVVTGCLFLILGSPNMAQPPKLNWSDRKVQVYVTAQNTEYRLSSTDGIRFERSIQPLEKEITVFLDSKHTFQTFLGIGGAITDASAETYAKLPADKKQELISAYYDAKNGIGYTLARTNIESCDFSSDTYSYVTENDKMLKTFSVQHDERYRIPMIKEAMAKAGKLTLFASPWSPPAWMKDNMDMLHGGKLLAEYRQTWANFFVKFIKAYERQGIPIWGISVQNEPMATQKWESCIFTDEEERDFIKNYLGPTLHKQGLGSKKLIAWDHNRDMVYQRASTILNDPKAAKYVWGIGYHWYETWTGGGMLFDNVKMVNKTFPDKNLLFTEGCAESFNMDRINNWVLGEKYGYSMINDFNSGTVGWTDWNILLDEMGGPNHVGNYCFAPVIADTRNGSLIYTNAYYYIGHFSKFIHSGAKRINASSSRDVLETTAFKNTDGSTAVIIMNRTDKQVPFKLWQEGMGASSISLPHSIMTLVF